MTGTSQDKDTFFFISHFLTGTFLTEREYDFYD